MTSYHHIYKARSVISKCKHSLQEGINNEAQVRFVYLSMIYDSFRYTIKLEDDGLINKLVTTSKGSHSDYQLLELNEHVQLHI